MVGTGEFFSLVSIVASGPATATATISVNGADVSVDATVRAYDASTHTVVVKIDRQAISAAILEAVGTGKTVEDPTPISVTVSGGGASVTRTGELDWFSHPCPRPATRARAPGTAPRG